VIHAFDDAFVSVSSPPATDATPDVNAGLPGRAAPSEDTWSSAMLATLAQTEIAANATAASPREVEIRRAEERVAAARSMLQQAQADQERAANSPEAVALRAAERELANARNMVTIAQQDLQRLSEPNPVMLEAAEREVQRAQATLRIIRTTRPPHDDPDAQANQASALGAAQVALNQAIFRRDGLRAGPEPQQVARSQQTLAAAERQLEDARLRYDATVRAAPLPDLDAADAAVLAARRAVYDAEADLQALRSPTTQDRAAETTDRASRPGT
jgi:hypothetical protein